MLLISYHFLFSPKLLLVTLALCISTVAQRAEPRSDVLARKVPEPLVEHEDSLQKSFMWALVQTKTPGGLVFSSNVDPNTRFKLSPSTLALRDVLDAIVRSEPQYEWNIFDGVVNLDPIREQTPLLNTQLGNVTIENATALHMVDTIEDAPEIRRASLSLGFANSGAKEYDGPVGQTVASIYCHNCSLRDALNEIVRANGRAVWFYREYEVSGKKYFALGLLFQT